MGRICRGAVVTRTDLFKTSEGGALYCGGSLSGSVRAVKSDRQVRRCHGVHDDAGKRHHRPRERLHPVSTERLACQSRVKWYGVIAAHTAKSRLTGGRSSRTHLVAYSVQISTQPTIQIVLTEYGCLSNNRREIRFFCTYNAYGEISGMPGVYKRVGDYGHAS